MSWTDQQEAKFKDLRLKAETLTFSAVRKFQENEIAIDYSLKIDGDQIKGRSESVFGGEKRDWDIKAKREKRDK